MEIYQVVLVEDLDKLAHKIERLQAYIESHAFTKLSVSEQHLMRRQHLYMTQYANMLKERIRRFE